MQCSVYYQTPENGEYLCQVVMATARLGQVKHVTEISGMDDAGGVDVVLVEYQDNNPELDNWLVQVAGQPGSPEIFLFVAEVSLPAIWKSVKLGAWEIFSRSLAAEDFQEALTRTEIRQARLRRQNLNRGSRPSAPGPGTQNTKGGARSAFPHCLPRTVCHGN